MALTWPRAGHFNRALLNASTNTLLASTSYNVYASDGTTPLTIYTDKNKTSTISQPLTTDTAGNAGFYAEPYGGAILSVAGVTEVIDILPDPSDLLNNFISDGGSHTSAYTLSAADNLKALGFGLGLTNTSTITITVPNDLPANFTCDVWNEGTATIAFQAASGTTIRALGVAAGSVIHHPGFAGACTVMCTSNAGTAAKVFITNGVT
jgi:hypothetical protein